MALQITELRKAPDPKYMEPLRNPPLYRHGDVRQWLVSRYKGNKPTGGLWTSTHTPDDEYACDWQRGRNTNALVWHAYPDQDGLTPYRLIPNPDATVLHVQSLADAEDFTRAYRLARIPLPEALGPLVTSELTDWQRAACGYDGIHLTAEAADEVAWAMVNRAVVTAFHTWNCESTLWARWVF